MYWAHREKVHFKKYRLNFVRYSKSSSFTDLHCSALKTAMTFAWDTTPQISNYFQKWFVSFSFPCPNTHSRTTSKCVLFSTTLLCLSLYICHICPMTSLVQDTAIHVLSSNTYICMWTKDIVPNCTSVQFNLFNYTHVNSNKQKSFGLKSFFLDLIYGYCLLFRSNYSAQVIKILRHFLFFKCFSLQT